MKLLGQSREKNVFESGKIEFSHASLYKKRLLFGMFSGWWGVGRFTPEETLDK